MVDLSSYCEFSRTNKTVLKSGIERDNIILDSYVNFKTNKLSYTINVRDSREKGKLLQNK